MYKNTKTTRKPDENVWIRKNTYTSSATEWDDSFEDWPNYKRYDNEMMRNNLYTTLA